MLSVVVLMFDESFLEIAAIFEVFVVNIIIHIGLRVRRHGYL